MPDENDLHPYQRYCVDFLEEKPQCALFLDCGLGKTIITLTAISHLLYDSFEVSRVLIIAPLRVARDTWIGELSKWEHLKGLRMERVIGSPRERVAALSRKAELYIINRENVESMTGFDRLCGTNSISGNSFRTYRLSKGSFTRTSSGVIKFWRRPIDMLKLILLGIITFNGQRVSWANPIRLGVWMHWKRRRKGRFICRDIFPLWQIRGRSICFSRACITARWR